MVIVEANVSSIAHCWTATSLRETLQRMLCVCVSNDCGLMANVIDAPWLRLTQEKFNHGRWLQRFHSRQVRFFSLSWSVSLCARFLEHVDLCCAPSLLGCFCRAYVQPGRLHTADLTTSVYYLLALILIPIHDFPPVFKHETVCVPAMH